MKLEPVAWVKSSEWEDALKKRQSFNGWRIDYGDCDMRLYAIPPGYKLVPVEQAKDSERLDWIQDNARCDPKMDGNHVWHPLTWNQAKRCVGNNIRAAIDAAIEGEQ